MLSPAPRTHRSAAIPGFEQYRDRLSKNTCDSHASCEVRLIRTSYQRQEKHPEALLCEQRNPCVLDNGSDSQARVANMRVVILGSGLMGGKLGTIFARAGHEVVFTYARSEEKLKKLARDAGRDARAGTPNEAAPESDALLLAVHWSRIEDVLNQTGDLFGKVVVSCSLPMNDDNTELVVAHTSSGAEELARRLPNARVVSAFNTVPSEVLFGVYETKSKGRRPSLVYCGDDERGKGVAAELIRDVGFDPLDAGPLRIARYTEPFALLVAELAYEREGGPELAYRFKWLKK
jgi:8-hydroxy-5-deazaflavin:NADPH oxidoreductase